MNMKKLFVIIFTVILAISASFAVPLGKQEMKTLANLDGNLELHLSKNSETLEKDKAFLLAFIEKAKEVKNPEWKAAAATFMVDYAAEISSLEKLVNAENELHETAAIALKKKDLDIGKYNGLVQKCNKLVKEYNNAIDKAEKSFAALEEISSSL